ncbi:hypothetical protein F4808DRAFT_412613 [Astrocystis sublimbata]|nr:hypothetical protein F4808DRAFT_412613 [Astrocystis sublimbata]
MSYHEQRAKRVETRSTTERQKTTTASRLVEKRKSPRNLRSSDGSVKESRQQKEPAPRPLTEKRKSDENVQVPEKELAIRTKMTAEMDRKREVNDTKDTDNDAANHSHSPRKRTKRGNTGKARLTRGVDRYRDENRNWTKRSSPPLKRGRLEDEMPMIIQCWQ